MPTLLPFIYDLHDELALGATGALILGFAALLWTIDRLVGAYLTFPARAAHARSPAEGWLVRWTPARLVRRHARRFKLFYNLAAPTGCGVGVDADHRLVERRLRLAPGLSAGRRRVAG